jgi:hypothetical protein
MTNVVNGIPLSIGALAADLAANSTFVSALSTAIAGQIAGSNLAVTPAGQVGALTTLTIGQIVGRQFHVDNFGAQGNAQQITAAFTISNGGTTLTAGSPVFTSAMTGQTICLPGAGVSVTWPANGTWPGGTFPGYLIAVMTYVSATQVTLSVAASAALSAALFTVNVGTDDSAAFVAGFAAISAASPEAGGQLWISPQKRYLCATQQIVMPANSGLYCESHLRDKNSTGFFTQGGVIILPPGAPCSTANSGNPGTGNAWNPQRTTMAIVVGASGWIDGVTILAAGAWSAQTALDMEASVWGTQYGMVVSGNGVQLDKASGWVRNSAVLGFGQGVVNTVLKTSGGNLVGYAARHPNVDTCLLDNACNILYGPSSTNTEIENCTCTYWLTAGNVGAGPTQCTFPPPVSDGAGGSIISLTSSLTTLGGASGTPVWSNGFNQYIGQCSAGQTLTVTVFDSPLASGLPMTNTGGGFTANRVVGTLVVSTTNAQGFDLHLPNSPANGTATNWTHWGAVSNGTVGAIGDFGTIPAALAFTACSIRPNSDIYLDGAQFCDIDACIFTGGNGIQAAATSTIHITNPKFDGANQDAGTATNGFALSLTGATGNGFWTGGSVNNFFGGVQNLASGSPWNWQLSNIQFQGPIVPIFQNGMPMAFNGGSLGGSGTPVRGSSALSFSFNGTFWTSGITVVQASSGTPFIANGGTNPPAALVAAGYAAGFSGLPTAPINGTVTMWLNGGVVMCS